MYFSSTLFENYELAVLLKIVLAVVAGAIIGMEREMPRSPCRTCGPTCWFPPDPVW